MSQRFCTQCGAELPAGGNFCPQCGAPVEQDAEDVPVVQATTAKAEPTAQLAAELSDQDMAREKGGGFSSALLYALVGIAVVAVLVGGYFAFLQPDGAGISSGAELSDCGEEPCTIEAVTAVEQNAPDIPYPEIARVSPDDAHMRLASDAALFVDVRDVDSYTSLHIPGALSIPLDEINARLGELPKGAEIITYCT